MIVQFEACSTKSQCQRSSTQINGRVKTTAVDPFVRIKFGDNRRRLVVLAARSLGRYFVTVALLESRKRHVLWHLVGYLHVLGELIDVLLLLLKLLLDCQ